MDTTQGNPFLRMVAHLQRNPRPLFGFVLGALLPLTIVALFWAQTSGGLAGPLVDTRPPAFIVPTD